MWLAVVLFAVGYGNVLMYNLQSGFDTLVQAQRVGSEYAGGASLDAPGYVSWWSPERGHVTLQQVLVHLVAEVARHAGHADILRETIDGAAGRRPGDPSLAARTDEEWAAWRDRLEAAARAASGR